MTEPGEMVVATKEEEDALATKRRFQAPDGGWGWVVVFSSFCSMLIHGGAWSMFGQFFPELLEAFGEGETKTVSVASVQFIFQFGTAMVAGSLCDVLGCKIVLFTGTALSVLGFAITSVSPSLNWIFFSLGTLHGIGLGLQYISLVVVVQVYFDSKRAIAMGLAGAGIGCGTFAYGPLVRILIDVYGWRGAYLILAGVYSHCFIFGSFFRPLPELHKSLINSPTVTSVDNELTKGNVKCSSGECQTPMHRVTSSGSIILSGYNKLEEEKKLNVCLDPSWTPGQCRCKTDLSDASKSKERIDVMIEHASSFTRRTFDIRLFVNVYVIMFLVCSSCVSTSYSAPYTFLPKKCFADGITKYETAFIISMMGLADIMGKVISGLVGYKVNTTIVYIVVTMIASIGIVCNALSHTFSSVLVSSVVTNFGLGGYISMSTTVLVSYVGVHNFARVYGFVCLGTMLGMGVGGPLGALVHSVTHSYRTVFLVYSAFPLTASLGATIILAMRKRDCWPVEEVTIDEVDINAANP